MFEITIPPAPSVLPVQHDLILDGVLLDVGQGMDDGKPPPKFIVQPDFQVGQGDGGGKPPPKFISYPDFQVGQGGDVCLTPSPPKGLGIDAYLDVGQQSDGPPPPQGK